MTAVSISTVQQAIEYLAQYHDAQTEIPDFTFTGDIAEFTAHIDGPRYHSSVPAELARGLWEFQSELYRAVAFALYGVDNMVKLTAGQRADFQLVFRVSEGTTSIMAGLEKFLEKMGEGIASGISSMDSKDRKISIIAVAIVLALAYGGISIADTYGDIKKDEVKAQLEMDKEAQKTAQFELFAQIAKDNNIAARFASATAEGARAIVKGAADADSLRVGKVKFNREEIREVNQRAAKENATAKILSERFVIVQVQVREQSSTKLWLAKEGAEFPVVLSDEDLDADSLKKLWDAVRDRKPIALEVNATIIRGQIKAGQIIKVL